MSQARSQKPQAILFDLDGTLLDTAGDLGAALNQVLTEYQRPTVPETAFRPLASHGANGLLTLGFGADYAPQKAVLRQRFLDVYEANIARYTLLFNGVEALLNELRAQQIQVAIVTNKPTFLTAQVLPQFPTLASIDVVVCGDTLSVAKPAPEPLLHAAERLGVQPDQCWYVGDAERDIQAGRNAGMYTVLAEYGYIHADDAPEQWLADAHIDTPEALLALL